MAARFRKGRTIVVRPFFRFARRADVGAGDRNRTCDPLITNQMLYLLSYTGDGVENEARGETGSRRRPFLSSIISNGAGEGA